MRMLVNTPTGKQELIAVGVGGGYFDIARVIWDERIDGQLPAIQLGGMVRVGDGLTYNASRYDEHLAAIAPPAPRSVTMRQAELALLSAGLLDDVEALVATLSQAHKSEWKRATVVERSNELVAVIQAEQGMTDAHIDELFILAATL